MIFNSYIFLFVFLPVAFAGFWILRGRQARYLWLTAMSYIFYGYWNYKFTFLMFAVTLIGYAAGRALEVVAAPKRKKILLACAIGANLALLGFFKYTNFALATLGLPALDIILPIGISFYAFQVISYLVDVYRETVRPTKNFLEFAAYVSFFPQLIAGPIVRMSDVAADLDNIHLLKRSASWRVGISMFVIGLTKKVMIADSLAILIDPLWENPASLGALAAWTAALGYTYQLYFDFSGYSDMAIGLGRLFGVRFPVNFNSPYKAVNISDFWRRWHITLSSWLRDYLYLPLGGSRRGALRTVINLCVVMLLGGLWHGANWTFVLWGGYHGALLALYHVTKPWYDRIPVVLQRAATFFAVVLGWVVFRSPTISSAGTMLKNMFSPSAAYAGHLTGALLLIAGCLIVTNFFKNSNQLSLPAKKRYAVAFAAATVLALVFMNYKQNVFLYYQF